MLGHLGGPCAGALGGGFDGVVRCAGSNHFSSRQASLDGCKSRGIGNSGEGLLCRCGYLRGLVMRAEERLRSIIGWF